jgi:hypothetical protein
MKKYLLIIISLCVFAGCGERKFDLHYDHDNVIYLNQEEIPEMQFHTDVYVPAYSDIYYETEEKKTYLTVILSLRNVSFTDTIYFNKINYYGSGGGLLKEYIKKVLVLRPMESMEYIVESADKKGGSGANFVVSYMSKDSLVNPPLVESIMMGNLDGYRFSFASRGVKINK